MQRVTVPYTINGRTMVYTDVVSSRFTQKEIKGLVRTWASEWAGETGCKVTVDWKQLKIESKP